MPAADQQITRSRPGRPRGERSAPRAARRGPRPDAEDFGMFQEFDNFSTLPFVPDTRDWHYCWVRVSDSHGPDAKNLRKFLYGPVRYEVVPVSEMMELQEFRATHAAGANGEAIQIDDVVLMRCPQPLYQKQQRYYEYVAKMQSRTVKAETKDAFKDAGSGVRLTTYDDREEGGLEVVEAGGDDE